MANQRFAQTFRRRRTGKTDYRKRGSVILGRKPFLSIRVSNKYVYGQIMRPTPEGDITLCASSSRDLSKDYGWKGSSKNLPSAYLTGYLLGREATRKKVEGTTVYSGVSRFIHGSRIASFLSGAMDAGLELELEDEILPDKERTKGTHIAAYAKKLFSENSQRYEQVFSSILSKGLKPEDYGAHFDQVKALIQQEDGEQDGAHGKKTQ